MNVIVVVHTFGLTVLYMNENLQFMLVVYFLLIYIPVSLIQGTDLCIDIHMYKYLTILYFLAAELQSTLVEDTFVFE